MARPRQYADPAAKQRAYRARVAREREQARGAPGPPVSRTVSGGTGEGRWRALLAEAEATLARVCEEMEGHFEARSEAWQESERGERLQERVEAIQDALERLGEARS
jgi:hypothetical protein